MSTDLSAIESHLSRTCPLRVSWKANLPRCPYPHVAGKINPMTADEWMQACRRLGVGKVREAWLLYLLPFLFTVVTPFLCKARGQSVSATKDRIFSKRLQRLQ